MALGGDFYLFFIHYFLTPKLNSTYPIYKLKFQGKDLSVILSRTYMPFGAGSRLGLGAEFAKMQMAIFIHHLCRYTFVFYHLMTHVSIFTVVKVFTI